MSFKSGQSGNPKGRPVGIEQQMIKELEREATQGFQAGADLATTALTPHKIPSRIRQWYEEISLGKHASRMADIFTITESMANLRKQAEVLRKGHVSDEIHTGIRVRRWR